MSESYLMTFDKDRVHVKGKRRYKGILFKEFLIPGILSGNITETRRYFPYRNILRVQDGKAYVWQPMKNRESIRECHHLRFGDTLFLKTSVRQRSADSAGLIKVSELRLEMLHDITQESVEAEGFNTLLEYADYWNSCNKNMKFIRNWWVWRLIFKIYE